MPLQSSSGAAHQEAERRLAPPKAGRELAHSQSQPPFPSVQRGRRKKEASLCSFQGVRRELLTSTSATVEALTAGRPEKMLGAGHFSKGKHPTVDVFVPVYEKHNCTNFVETTRKISSNTTLDFPQFLPQTGSNSSEHLNKKA